MLVPLSKASNLRTKAPLCSKTPKSANYNQIFLSMLRNQRDFLRGEVIQQTLFERYKSCCNILG